MERRIAVPTASTAPPRVRSAAAAFVVVVSLLVALLVSLAALTAGHASAAFEAGATATVRADGDCLRLRATPGLDGAVITCLIEGSSVTLLGDEAESDGYLWRFVATDDDDGWVAGAYLELSTAATPTEPPAPSPPPVTSGPAAALPLPPPGGLTLGLAGTADPAALAAAQPFDVESISVLDIATQRFLVYIPGAPPAVNSLTAAHLRPDGVATLRRAGSKPSLPPPPYAAAATSPALGTPNALPAPPEGGLTQGLSGTTDPPALEAAQGFEVLSISVLHVATQRWLVHIPGAPAAASTLHRGSLAVDSVVTIRAGSVPAIPPPPPSPTPTATPTPTPTPTATPTPTPTATPTPVASDPLLATISYYYCTLGSIPASIGDGGGFCGAMANGETVHAGAASCASVLMGQRFRIEGDPTDRVYTCSDTGGGVTSEHRDIWFENSDEGYLWWQVVGPSAVIEIVSE